MRFNPAIPMLSAVIAVVIVIWLRSKWIRWVPAKAGTIQHSRLVKKHKTTVLMANVLSVIGLCSSFPFYIGGQFNHGDWRGLGVGIGLMAVLPVGYMAAVNAARGAQAVKECLMAYAISQKVPADLVFTTIGILFVAGVVSATSLLL